MKRKPIKRSPAKRRTDKEASQAWARRARSKGCAVCGAANPQGHHVIKQQVLRLHAPLAGREYERVRWDTRNLLPLCERHHLAHHNASKRLRLALVELHCPKIRQFASELGIDWWLEREYVT